MLVTRESGSSDSAQAEVARSGQTVRSMWESGKVTEPMVGEHFITQMEMCTRGIG